ncbi:MAG: response regulator [Methanococcaceae archaeon]
MAKAIKILIIEDVSADALLLQAMIKKCGIEFESQVVKDEPEYRQVLAEMQPDIILSDFSLPQFNGMRALEILRSYDNITPFILVTGSLNEEIAVACMKSGADDYLLKDNLKRIGSAIENALLRKKERSEKLLAEKALRQSEESYRLLVETSPDGIFVNKDGIIVYVNNAMLKIFGAHSPQEIIGRKILDYIHPDYHSMVTQRVGIILEQHTSMPLVEEKFFRLDGSVVEVEVVAAFCTFGDSPAIQVIARDITERLRTRQEILQAKEKAEEASRLKSSLLANMNHEFRTPLTGILGFAEIIKEELDGSAASQMAQNIIKSGKRLLNTLTSILDLSELESGRFNVHLDEINLSREARSAVKQFQAVAAQKNLEMQSNIADDILVMADSNFIRQIINNLIDNSIKYTSHGKISLEVDSFIDGAGIHFARLKVKDTGIGIRKENQEIIFHEFRQASEGMGRIFEGNGLGLTITKKMVELMKGSISVYSEPGMGSEFSVTLPLVSMRVKEEAKAPAALINKPVQKEESEGNKILPEVLLVEDNFINMQVTSLYLRNICRILHARNALTAIKMAASKNYCAILMDINLGAGMNGIEAAKEIKKLDGYKDIPIIAITGYAMAGDKEQLLNEGFTHYIAKPFDKEEIIRLMEEVLIQPVAGQ